MCAWPGEWKYSLSVQIPDRRSPSVAPSIIVFNVGKGIRLEVINEPDDLELPLGDLREAGTHLHRLERDQ